jgi:nitroreductase
MNTVLEAISARYSCRSFTDEPISRDDLEAIARAGVQAPSSRGNAPWYLAVVTDRELIDAIRDSAWELIQRHSPATRDRIMGRGGDLFYNAQALIVVATKTTHDATSEEFDAGLLTENICLAATSLGLATCVCGLATQAFRDLKGDSGENFSKALNFPWGHKMTIGILLGHPSKPGSQHPTDTSTIAYFE